MHYIWKYIGRPLLWHFPALLPCIDYFCIQCLLTTLSLISHFSLSFHIVLSSYLKSCFSTHFRANDLQQELDEYTENSAQLEKELETSLAQAEKENRDLKFQNNRFRNEIDSLRVSFTLLKYMDGINIICKINHTYSKESQLLYILKFRK